MSAGAAKAVLGHAAQQVCRSWGTPSVLGEGKISWRKRAEGVVLSGKDSGSLRTGATPPKEAVFHPTPKAFCDPQHFIAHIISGKRGPEREATLRLSKALSGTPWAMHKQPQKQPRNVLFCYFSKSPRKCRNKRGVKAAARRQEMHPLEDPAPGGPRLPECKNKHHDCFYSL